MSSTRTASLALLAIGVALASGCAKNPTESGLPSERAPCPPGDYSVRFDTTKGTFRVEVHEAWAPHGARRFRELVQSRYYDGTRFFRVIDGFMAQAGIHGDPRVSAMWAAQPIADDPPKRSNTRGTVAMARSGAPDSATAQFFVNTRDNAHLDASGYSSPFGCVADGLAVVDALYSDYGEGGRGGPDQKRIMDEGEPYLAHDFPLLDRVIRATVR